MSDTTLRPLAGSDRSALHGLVTAWETHWYGAPEQSEDELADTLDLIDSGVVAVDAGGAIRGYAGRWNNGSTLVADPSVEAGAADRMLVGWLTDAAAPEVEVLADDTVLAAALTDRGWTYALSAFDLTRAVDVTTRLDDPAWPADVEVCTFGADDARALYRLIYDDSGWAEVPGHHRRDFEQWWQIFLEGRAGAELPILVRSGGELAAAAVLRHWDDGSGYVAQLAVGRDHRRRGLARALLLEAFRRLIDDGATRLDLAVSADNRGALDLYLSVGLTVAREWQVFHLPS